MVDERLAAHVGALHALALEVALDHHLGGDAGMVHADHPQRVLALEAGVADENVLERVVESVADVQRTGDVGRRDDDGEGLGLGACGAEHPLAFPARIPARLDLGGVEGLCKLGHGGGLYEAPPRGQWREAAMGNLSPPPRPLRRHCERSEAIQRRSCERRGWIAASLRSWQ
jgi:hypothetical protein